MAALLCRLSRDQDAAARVGKSITRIFCGTAPLPDRVREGFRRTFGRSLRESYGMSEVLLVSVQNPRQAERGPGTGTPLPGVELSSRDVAGHDVPELLLRSPWVLQRYLTEDSECSPLTPEGDMPTGDVGELVEGQLVITGRLKDLIIRGGINISPKRIESVIMKERDVVECAVIAVPDDFWGEIPIACIVAAQDHEPDLADRVRSRCLRELGEGMRPDGYEFLTALPKSATGKVRKHRLRALVRNAHISQGN
jgi:long-chain acyl-CoA synthetase